MAKKDATAAAASKTAKGGESPLVKGKAPSSPPTTPTKTTTDTPTTPTTPAPACSTSSSSSLLFFVLPALVAIVGGISAFGVPPLLQEGLTASGLLGNINGTQGGLSNGTAGDLYLEDDKYPTLRDKYASDLVQMTTRRLLPANPAGPDACPAFEVVGDLTHVDAAMARADEDQLRADGLVFLMLNGENDGLFVKWSTADECLRELAAFAAEQLGADADLLPNGLRLMTQMGEPITTAAELDGSARRIAHVLLDMQIWVWPGIKVGYEFDVEGVRVKTLSMRPRVFGVENFFTDEEAQEIMRQGINRLERSPVDSPDAVDGYHSDRTSFTAFLFDNAFTRDFRKRTSKLTRLPSPSFTERLQLVRYETGQFFRKHEDYFDSKQFLPKKDLGEKEYSEWCAWASAKLRDLIAAGVDLPADFREGGNMFPDVANKLSFQHGLLGAFLEDAKATDFFTEHADVDWGTWIEDNLMNKANDIMEPLLKDKAYMFPFMIKSWEKRLGREDFQYQIPKHPVSGVTHYFRWIRWAKERIQDLMDQDSSLVPEEFQPNGRAFPTYNILFQNVLTGYILEDYTEEELTSEFGAEWTKWFIENKDSKDVVWQALKVTDKLFDMIVSSYAKRAGQAFNYEKPKHLQHFEPNRFVTVFLYLNECPEGGETVFPYSKERLVTNIEREGMAECSEGLAVPPTKLTAAMFYAQTPENFPDPSSLHGGCPPARGTKYGANSFAWNADSDEGANAWDLGADLKAYPTED